MRLFPHASKTQRRTSDSALPRRATRILPSGPVVGESPMKALLRSQHSRGSLAQAFHSSLLREYRLRRSPFPVFAQILGF